MNDLEALEEYFIIDFSIGVFDSENNLIIRKLESKSINLHKRDLHFIEDIALDIFLKKRPDFINVKLIKFIDYWKLK